MDPIFYIIFGISAAMVAVWLVLDTFRRAKERGELRREVYLKELEKAAAENENTACADQEKQPEEKS